MDNNLINPTKLNYALLANDLSIAILNRETKIQAWTNDINLCINKKVCESDNPSLPELILVQLIIDKFLFSNQDRVIKYNNLNTKNLVNPINPFTVLKHLNTYYTDYINRGYVTYMPWEKGQLNIRNSLLDLFNNSVYITDEKLNDNNLFTLLEFGANLCKCYSYTNVTFNNDDKIYHWIRHEKDRRTIDNAIMERLLNNYAPLAIILKSVCSLIISIDFTILEGLIILNDWFGIDLLDGESILFHENNYLSKLEINHITKKIELFDSNKNKIDINISNYAYRDLDKNKD